MSNEEIEALKNNSKVIHDYFLFAYKEENKKENTHEEDIKKEITHLLNELKDVTGSHEINGIKRLLNKCTHVKGNKIMNWENVQKSAQDIINIIEKI